MRSLRLDDRFVIEVEAEPIEVLDYSPDEFGTTAAGIEIFDPKKPFSA